MKKHSDMFLKLHISEHTGRGVPEITEVYGEGIFIRLNEERINVWE